MISVYKYIIAVLICTSVAVTAQGQDDADQTSFVDEIDALTEGLLDRYSVPGAAVAIIDDGRIVHVRGYGVENVSSGKPVTASTRFRVGSLSKTFTAWGVMALVEDNVLDLDAPVSSYLERWSFPTSIYDESRISLRRLLSHTAGTSVEYYDGYASDEGVPTLVELLDGKYRDYERVEVINTPGLKWEYSGGGYTVAQLAVEDVTGETFSSFMTRTIFDSLDLTNTTFDQDAQRSDAHNLVGSSLEKLSYPALASGGMLSTVEDVATFVVAGLGASSSAARSGVPVSDEGLLELQSPAPDTRGGYGLGYSTRLTPAGDAVVGHGAALEGWHANFAMLPARGKGIVILTNSTSGGNVSTAIRCAWYSEVMGPIPAGTCKTDIAALLVKPLREDGVDAAIALYKELALREEQYVIDEWQLNDLGYDLIDAGRVEQAVQIFEFNVELYPDASNPHDSLAEAYVRAGRQQDAIVHFKRSLELDPTNENARSMLAQLGGS